MHKKALFPLLLLIAALACNLPALSQDPIATVTPPSGAELIGATLPRLQSNRRTQSAGGIQRTQNPQDSVLQRSESAVPQTPTATATATAIPFLGTLQLDTLYEGPQTYTCDAGGCWRQNAGTTHPPEYYFTGIDSDTPEVRALLQSLALPSEPTDEDGEIWARTQRIWQWLNLHAVDMVANNETADAKARQAVDTLSANSYGLKPPRFPMLQDYANSFLDFGVMARLSCTDRALNFAMLLYRAGVPVDRVAVVIANFAPTRDVGQHLFVVEYLGGEWYYIDPTCTNSHPALSAAPERVGCTSADYAHPYGITVLPGSTLTEAMLADPRPTTLP